MENEKQEIDGVNKEFLRNLLFEQTGFVDANEISWRFVAIPIIIKLVKKYELEKAQEWQKGWGKGYEACKTAEAKQDG